MYTPRRASNAIVALIAKEKVGQINVPPAAPILPHRSRINSERLLFPENQSRNSSVALNCRVPAHCLSPCYCHFSSNCSARNAAMKRLNATLGRSNAIPIQQLRVPPPPLPFRVPNPPPEFSRAWPLFLSHRNPAHVSAAYPGGIIEQTISSRRDQQKAPDAEHDFEAGNSLSCRAVDTAPLFCPVESGPPGMTF